MKWNGLNFKLAPHLSYRDTDINRDIDADGVPQKHKYYVAIVYQKDCTTREIDGQTYLVTDHAPAIPISHGGTNYGYGKCRKYRNYYTRPVYLVRDGRVYTTTIQYDEQPKDYKK